MTCQYKLLVTESVDGTVLGQSGQKAGCYGVTPVVKAAAVTALTTTPTATDVATAVNAIITALKNFGLTS